MVRFIWSALAVVLYVAMFASIIWFFDAPNIVRGAVAAGSWLVTLPVLYIAGKQHV